MRVVSVLATIYFCGLIVLLNHRPKYGRWILGYLDSNLNKQVTRGMHTYDDDCELTWENIADNFDHYYCCHLIGWFLCSFVIRDFYLLHMWHLMHELIELSWQHILPHFRECWWDHIGCDILLSNVPGVMIGLWVQRKLGLMRYDFWGSEGKKSVGEWLVWGCHKRFGIMCYIQVLLMIQFLGSFFLMNNLLIPPKHPLPVLRLLLWLGLGSVAFREGYEDARTWNTA
jgi:phosphatidylserine synthase 2